MPASNAHQNPQRRLWRAYEPVHAICYFHPRFPEALVETGLTGWWNGYFAGRAAPLGVTPVQVVTALFYGFAPAMVARAIPKIWTRITPVDAIQSRLTTAETVLAEHASAGSTQDLRRVADNLARVIDALDFDGRALASAWHSVPRPSSTLGRLWLAATILREHRGDGHVIAATACGLTGLQASVTHIAAGQVDREVLRRSRGWSDHEWESAERELRERDILSAPDTLTSRGVSLRDRVEDLTDQLASPQGSALDDAGWTIEILTSLARTLVDSGAVPVPNPIGVPRP